MPDDPGPDDEPEDAQPEEAGLPLLQLTQAASRARPALGRPF
jgi:hypothetical protein